MDKLIVFDVWGNYGYFRSGYTSTSTITHPFPPRTTITGLISAIIGLPKKSYSDIFSKENSKIGLRLLNPVDKMNINLNYINTKSGLILSDISKNPRVQVQAEYVRNPKYRIYVSFNDEYLMKALFNNLSEHKSYYTPCLGVSECLADFKLTYPEMLPLQKEHGTDIEINSILLKKDSVNQLVMESGKKYTTNKSQGFMNDDGVVTEYLEYFYESNGQPIKLSEADYYNVRGENIVLY